MWKVGSCRARSEKYSRQTSERIRLRRVTTVPPKASAKRAKGGRSQKTCDYQPVGTEVYEDQGTVQKACSTMDVLRNPFHRSMSVNLSCLRHHCPHFPGPQQVLAGAVVNSRHFFLPLYQSLPMQPSLCCVHCVTSADAGAYPPSQVLRYQLLPRMLDCSPWLEGVVKFQNNAIRLRGSIADA